MISALEQETASVARFVLDAEPGLSPYYWSVPEDFRVPAVYFPPPVFPSKGDTFKTYALKYDWPVKFFASTDEEAQAIAARVMNKICAARLLIPLIDEAGELTGKGLRMKDPELKRADENAYQINLRWDSRRPYNQTDNQKMMTYGLTIYTDDADRPAH